MNTQLTDEFIPVIEAARRLHMAPSLVRVSLQQGTFPVGFAFRKYGRRAKWIYCIPRKPFEAWINGDAYKGEDK